MGLASMSTYVEQREGGFYIAGTRISLDSIIHAFQDGESPEGILRSFPLAGPLVRIYGAITFYLEHKDEVETYLNHQERLWSDVETTQTVPPESLAARLHAAKEQASPRRA